MLIKVGQNTSFNKNIFTLIVDQSNYESFSSDHILSCKVKLNYFDCHGYSNLFRLVYSN